jgi:hypothetical protein
MRLKNLLDITQIDVLASVLEPRVQILERGAGISEQLSVDDLVVDARGRSRQLSRKSTQRALQSIQASVHPSPTFTFTSRSPTAAT